MVKMVYPYLFDLRPTVVKAVTYGKQTSMNNTHLQVMSGATGTCLERLMALILLLPAQSIFKASIISLPVLTFDRTLTFTP